MDVLFFLKQRTELIRHFYDAASAPFIETKCLIESRCEPYQDPGYDEGGEPPFVAEWIYANVEHELIGRAAVSMLSEALKQFFATWERKFWKTQTCASRHKKDFAEGFINGYVICFAERFGIDWKNCPADLDILKQVVLARNRAQHPDLVLDHLPYGEKVLAQFPTPFFVSSEEEGVQYDGNSFLSPTIHISREKLFQAIDHVERLLCLASSWYRGSLIYKHAECYPLVVSEEEHISKVSSRAPHERNCQRSGLVRCSAGVTH